MKAFVSTPFLVLTEALLQQYHLQTPSRQTLSCGVVRAIGEQERWISH